MNLKQILFGFVGAAVIGGVGFQLYGQYVTTDHTGVPLPADSARQIAFDLSRYSGARLKAAYPDADAFLGESLQPGEVDASAALIATLVEKTRADYYGPGKARRDAHPKSHGCVTATMQFDADLPAQLTGGVIQSGASYEALVRFSNGSPNPMTPDVNGDTRGMAIKLFGAPGEKLFSAPGDENVQDFIMISSPFFFINSAKSYTKFFEAINSGKIWKMAAIPFYLGVKGSTQAVRMMRQKIANPLETRYWSVVPSQLGTGDARQVIKFSARPLGPRNSQIPANPAPNFLRQAMATTLSRGPYQMEFMIQRRGNTELSVEDSIPEWPETKAAFQRVGVLTIHQQNFSTPERDMYCENQSFNPWHSLPAHRPLGMISRTRRVVYQAIAELRHQMNSASYPTGLPANENALP
ncbi:hypothetical protein AB9F45_27605 [Rhizobium leguminosarum]|uniref:hypothetical protein n=1 Tax=Rhizobium leguminosarum TaxID=384 RepID=UPI003F9ABB53